jgi:hypothetical protein
MVADQGCAARHDKDQRGPGFLSSAATFEIMPIPTRGVWIALLVSLAVHLSVLTYLAIRGVSRERPPNRLLVDVSIPESIVAPALPTYADAHPTVPEPPADTDSRHTFSLPLIVRPAEVDASSRGAMNLRVPAYVFEPPARAVAIDGPFDPDLAEAIAKRQQAQARVASSARRRAEREGAASGDYDREGAAGHAVKTATGCFDLRQEQSVSDAPLWWRTPCREARSSAWEQAEATEAQLHPSLRRH